MKAVRFHAHGGPEVLRVEDVADPVPSPGQALVRVRACALNHLDLWQRRGLEKVRIPLPHVSGSDIAGVVAESADGPLQPGTRVLVQPGLSCGRCEACTAGRDHHCASYGVVGYQSEGGCAEMVIVPTGNLVPLPDHVPFEEAAAFPLTFLTAWHMLVTRARVRPGETVVVLAAGSGVGQAAVQLARLHGARVIATAGSADKRSRALALGADHAIDHHVPFAATVRELTGGRGADVLVEHVGEATWPESVRALARGGRLVTCGATTGPKGELDLRVLFVKQIGLLGSYMGSKGELWEASRHFFAGRLRPAIDSVLPLDEAVSAHERLESGAHFGKIVLAC